MTSKDRVEIEATVNRYFEGMKNADVTMLRSAFHDEAGFFGYVGDDLFAGPVSGLFDWVAANLKPGDNGPGFRLEIENVAAHGLIATVTCRELGFVGHDFRQFFTLLKDTHGWRLTNKSFAALNG